MDSKVGPVGSSSGKSKEKTDNKGINNPYYNDEDAGKGVSLGGGNNNTPQKPKQ